MHGEQTRSLRAGSEQLGLRRLHHPGRPWAFLLLAASLAAPALARSSEGEDSRTLELLAQTGDGEPELEVEPAAAPLVLGQVERVALRVRSRAGAGAGEPKASVNVGRLGSFSEIEPGLFEVDYELPETRYPQRAVLALWHENGPNAQVAFFGLPLSGSATVPVQTRPGASVIVTVGDEDFGPFAAGGDGRAQARLTVPPGLGHATVTAQVSGRPATSQRIELGAPSYNRMTMAVVPAGLIADGVSTSRIHLFYDGSVRNAASRIALQASRGDPGRVVHHRGPLYRSELKASPGTPEGEIELQASVRGDSESRSSAIVRLSRQRVADLRIEPASLRTIADGSAEAELSVIAEDALGLGIENLEVSFDIEPQLAVESAALTELGRGRYRLRIRPHRMDPPAEAVDLEIAIRADGKSEKAAMVLEAWAPARLQVEPEVLRLPADGRSAAVVRLRAFDSTERPMDHLRPTVSASWGEVGRVEPVESGGFRLRYEAPAWSYRLPPRGRPSPPKREETIEIEVAGIESTVTAALTAGQAQPWLARAFLELGGGYRTDPGSLSGPQLSLHAGTYLVNLPRLLLGAELWAGASEMRGGWEILGSHSSEDELRVRTFPVIAGATLVVPLGAWSVGLGGGAGLLWVRSVGAPEAEDGMAVESLASALAGRLFIVRKAGAGGLVLDLSFLHPLQGGQIVGLSGQPGGPGATIGYRLER